MKYLYRFLILIAVAMLALPLYAVIVNVMIMVKTIPADISAAFGAELTNKAVIVWFVALAGGLISLFVNGTWRYLLVCLPLIAPSLYAILYILSL